MRVHSFCVFIASNMSQRSPPCQVNDEKSTVDMTPSPKKPKNSEKYRPKERELCQAVLCIKQHLPMRSLEQTIIRLHHTLNEKRKELTGEQMEDQNMQEGENVGGNYISLENQEDATFLLHEEGHNEGQGCENGKEAIDPYLSLPTAPASYQYKSSREEVKITYPKLHVRKQADNQQKIKIEQRNTIAKVFMQSGLNYQAYFNFMQVNGNKICLQEENYRQNMAKIFLLTIRKLQHFLIFDCGKFIKPFNNIQIRNLFEYITTFSLSIPSQIQFTLFSFLKASLGLSQISIRQTPAINLYLFLIKKLAKRNITLSSLEQIGKQEFLAKMKSTVQSLGNLKQQKNEMYEKKKHQRLERKERNSTQGDRHSQEDSKKSGEEVHLSLDWWDDQADTEFTKIYLRCTDPISAFRIFQSKHRQLTAWTPFHFNKKFSKLVRKAIQKTQIQSQKNQSTTSVLNKLSKEEMNKVVSSLEGQIVRKYLLQFYINPQPPIRLLAMAVQQTNRFLHPQLFEKKTRGRPRGSRNISKFEGIIQQRMEETAHFRPSLEYNEILSINQQGQGLEHNQNDLEFFYEDNEENSERKKEIQDREDEFYFEEDESAEFYQKLQIRSQQNSMENIDL